MAVTSGRGAVGAMQNVVWPHCPIKLWTFNAQICAHFGPTEDNTFSSCNIIIHTVVVVQTRREFEIFESRVPSLALLLVAEDTHTMRRQITLLIKLIKWCVQLEHKMNLAIKVEGQGHIC